MGSSLIFNPVYMNVNVPGKAIKKPKTADVPTASWIFFENIVKVGTLKLPPPIPIIADKKPIEELITKLIILDDGISLLTIMKFVFLSLIWDLIDDIEVKQITPSEDATATCMTISEP